MSLQLDMGTKPKGLTVKTADVGGMSEIVFLGEYEISMKDFLVVAKYVLTNTDLGPRDPRRQFVRCIKAMKEKKGLNPGRRILASDVPAIPRRKKKARNPHK